MSRGLPAVWSALLGAPFVAVGGYIYEFQAAYPLVAGQSAAPPITGVLLATFGLFVTALGLYVQFIGAPPAPAMRADESVVDDRDPAQRNALAQAFASIPFLAAGMTLLYFTERPLVYPTLALAVGLYLFSTGIHRYWRNTLTTYIVTNQRVMEEYRFLSLVRSEIPIEKVRSVEERQSMWESMSGRGKVRVRAGSTGGLTISIDDVYDATEFADVIRTQLGSDDARRLGADTAVTIPNSPSDEVQAVRENQSSPAMETASDEAFTASNDAEQAEIDEHNDDDRESEFAGRGRDRSRTSTGRVSTGPDGEPGVGERDHTDEAVGGPRTID
ncbi:PH domain-containing protein [Haloprofundus halobius]|uniref:PH domain-containing protein n=1 Tax=Haloprofundus halobius TaxID=2876194 RepID=UPI001CCBD43E|nr:PH domain-containing protein [Haloprofundus halobius]